MAKNKIIKCVYCADVLTRPVLSSSGDGRKKIAFGKKGYYCCSCNIKRWKCYLLNNDCVSLSLVKRCTKLATSSMRIVAMNLGVNVAERIICQNHKEPIKSDRKNVDVDFGVFFINASGVSYSWVVMDWLGLFGFKAFVKRSYHNMAGENGRRDVWFSDWAGQSWRGVNIGESQVLHCHKLFAPGDKQDGKFHVYRTIDYCTAPLENTTCKSNC